MLPAQPGLLLVRWNLQAGAGYDEARRQYYPFTELMKEDLRTFGGDDPVAPM